MSRKLQAEVDKLTKEVNVNIEAYDTRWQELKDFNRSQLGLKERMWEEARREQIRGKKHAVRTATLELLDFKHVCDSKGRIESDLETILRRLHRHKQQLSEWSCTSDLRQQADELRDLRKQVELRYKRGRVFYCRGESSEELRRADRADNSEEEEPTEEGLEQVVWCELFLKSLKRQKQEFEEQCRELRSPLSRRRQPSRGGGGVGAGVEKDRERSCPREINARESRRTQLETFIQLHETHCQRLSQIIRAITTQGYTIPAHQAHDLRDQLHQYVDNNDNLEYVVAEDIYMELNLPSSSSVGESNPDIVTSDDDDDVDDDVDDDDEESAVARVPIIMDSTSNGSSEAPAQENSAAAAAAATATITTTTSSSNLGPSPTGVASRKLQEIICIDTAVCDWCFAGPQHPEQTLSVKAGDILYVVRVDKSGWSYALKTNEGSGNASTALTPRRTHIDASHPTIVSGGWFPNHVRKSVHEWSVDQTSSVTEASIISAVTSTPRSESANLLERLQTLQQEEAQICCSNLAWLLSSLTAHIKPQSVCVIQWNWSQSWELANNNNNRDSRAVRYLDVSKGDRVWVLRLSPESDWVEVRKLDDWDYRAVGWIPATNLVSPREIVDNLILLDNITAPVKAAAAPSLLGPLHCYDDRRVPRTPRQRTRTRATHQQPNLVLLLSLHCDSPPLPPKARNDATPPKFFPSLYKRPTPVQAGASSASSFLKRNWRR